MCYCHRTISLTTWGEGGDWWCSPAKGIELAQDLAAYGIPTFLMSSENLHFKKQTIILICNFFWQHSLSKGQKSNKENNDWEQMGKHQYQNERIRKGDCIGHLIQPYPLNLTVAFWKSLESRTCHLRNGRVKNEILCYRLKWKLATSLVLACPKLLLKSP